jgi:hypothetical protein
VSSPRAVNAGSFQARRDLVHVLARLFDQGAYLVELFMC